MTIQVFSTPETAVQAEKPAGAAEGAQSLPEAKQAAEQKQSTVSVTEENEAEAKQDEISKDESDEDDSDEDAESKDAEKDKPKKKSGSQRRKERAERAEAEVARARAEADHWRALALKGAGESKPEPKAETAKAADEVGKPNPETFETHAEYVEALTDWKIEQREKARAAESRKAQLETEQQTLVKSHLERVKSFKESTDDFDDVVSGVDDVLISPTVRELILTSENSPALMYELAKNREEYERINKLPPLAAARAMGLIEAKLSKASKEAKPEPKKLTSAPKPIEPVGSKGGPVEKSIHDVAAHGSQAEYEAIRRKQLKQRAASW